MKISLVALVASLTTCVRRIDTEARLMTPGRRAFSMPPWPHLSQRSGRGGAGVRRFGGWGARLATLSRVSPGTIRVW